MHIDERYHITWRTGDTEAITIRELTRRVLDNTSELGRYAAIRKAIMFFHFEPECPGLLLRCGVTVKKIKPPTSVNSDQPARMQNADIAFARVDTLQDRAHETIDKVAKVLRETASEHPDLIWCYVFELLELVATLDETSALIEDYVENHPSQ